MRTTDQRRQSCQATRAIDRYALFYPSIWPEQQQQCTILDNSLYLTIFLMDLPTDMAAPASRQDDRIVHDLDGMQRSSITQGIGHRSTRRRPSMAKPSLAPIETNLKEQSTTDDLKLTRRRAARAVSSHGKFSMRDTSHSNNLSAISAAGASRVAMARCIVALARS